MGIYKNQDTIKLMNEQTMGNFSAVHGKMLTFIQAPLTIGHLVKIQLSDEHDFDDLMEICNIEFDQDKNGHSTIPKLTCTQDFFETANNSNCIN